MFANTVRSSRVLEVAEQRKFDTIASLPSREDRHGPGSLSPFLRWPGYQALCLTRGFAPPPHGGFAFVGKGLRGSGGYATAIPSPRRRSRSDCQQDQPFTIV